MVSLSERRQYEKIQSILARYAIALIIFAGLYVIFYVSTLVSIACFCWLNRGIDGALLYLGLYVVPVIGAILISKHEGSLFTGVVGNAVFKYIVNLNYLIFGAIRLIVKYFLAYTRN